MHATTRAPIRRLLLVEPQFLFRRTIVAVARELELADVEEATSVAAAVSLVALRQFDALIIDLDTEGNAIALISQLRNGNSKCDVAIPIAVLVGTCNMATVEQIRPFDVRRVLLKPFKVKGVLESIAMLLCTPAPALECKADPIAN